MNSRTRNTRPPRRVRRHALKKRTRLSIHLLLAACALCLIVSGCAKPARKVEEMAFDPGPEKVTFEVGDIMEFNFFYNPELNGVQTVRPDGMVALQLIGDVMAYGKTPEQLTNEIKEKFTSILRRPQLTVVVRNLPARRVYVGGEVLSPGPVDMQGPMTALEAIMFAGGFSMTKGDPANVILVRQENGKRFGCALDLKAAVAGKEGDSVYLKPHDIIWVPRTVIADLNQYIDQYINKMVPEPNIKYQFPLGKFPNGQFGSFEMDLKNTRNYY